LSWDTRVKATGICIVIAILLGIGVSHCLEIERKEKSLLKSISVCNYLFYWQ